MEQKILDDRMIGCTDSQMKSLLAPICHPSTVVCCCGMSSVGADGAPMISLIRPSCSLSSSKLAPAICQHLRSLPDRIIQFLGGMMAAACCITTASCNFPSQISHNSSSSHRIQAAQCCSLPPSTSSSSPSNSLAFGSSSCSSSSAIQDCWSSTRRQLLLMSGAAAAAAAASSAYAADKEAAADTTITDRVYFDLMECPSLARSDRTLGNRSLICTDGEDLGRIVIGLYGKQVPQTVNNFIAMCSGKAGSSYEGTIFNRVRQGQFIQGGRQGSKEKGEVAPPTHLDSNQELISSGSFKLRHARPGSVSLCLSENDDEEALKLNPVYRNVEFLITTGPGPAPQLDDGNIVFGTVLEGMDVVATVSTVPTYRPSGRIRQFNDLAEFFGDDRAANARALWDKPLKAVVIKSCGVLNST